MYAINSMALISVQRQLFRAAAVFSLAAFLTATSLVAAAASTGVFQSGPDFIAEVFSTTTGEPPSEHSSVQQKTLWLTEDIRSQAAKILGHQLAGLRVRYSQSGDKTAWILEEIGKEMPITIGVVVADNRIQQVKILAYRESRGGEVRYSAYTQQYRGATLTEELGLSQNIDGITGATLSVWAVNKVAALALYFHTLAIQQSDSTLP